MTFGLSHGTPKSKALRNAGIVTCSNHLCIYIYTQANQSLPRFPGVTSKTWAPRYFVEVTPRRNFGHMPWLAQPKVEEVVEAWKEAVSQ